MEWDAMRERPAVARLLRNDARVLDAVVALLADGGWSRFSIKQVSQRAGVSERMVAVRHPDRIAMAVAAWSGRLAAPFMARCDALFAAHGVGVAAPEGDLALAWAPFLSPDDLMRAALELIAQGNVNAPLRTAIARDAEERFLGSSAHTEPAQAVLAVRRAYLIMRALGLAALAPHALPTLPDLRDELLRLAPVFREEAAPKALPTYAFAPFLDESLDPDDAQIDALLRATCRHVADYGFHDASLDPILAEAGVGKRFALGRFRTKLAIFAEATRRLQAAAIDRNGALQTRLQIDHGAGEAEAAMLRASLHPDMRVARTLALEQLRISWSEPDVRAAFQHRALEQTERFAPILGARSAVTVHLSLADAEGLNLLPVLAPDAYTLPFDVVTLPMARLVPPLA